MTTGIVLDYGRNYGGEKAKNNEYTQVHANFKAQGIWKKFKIVHISATPA